MQKIVGIKFRSNSKVYYFNPLDIEFNVNDNAIVETVNGLEYGSVKIANTEIKDDSVKQPLKPVIRKANEDDDNQVAMLKKREDDAFVKTVEIIEQQQLNMKLVSAEYAFDGKKVIFYYTADSRVDFRELVKKLASIFHVRIEMRQINGRDDIRLRGALAPCGRACCCATFLTDFEKVTLKMAKVQNLSLNPTKINGMCGRLMCCLKYEEDFYNKAGKKHPPINSIVDTPDGSGYVSEVDIFNETVKVKLRKEDIEVINKYSLNDIRFKSKNAKETKPCCEEDMDYEETQD